MFGDTGEQLENMGNIVTSTATNEQGQQIIETFSTSPSVEKEGPAVDEKKTRDDRLNVIAAEILSEYRSKLKNKGKPKKNCDDDQKKTLTKLSFHEKHNKNSELFSLHITEEILDTKSTIYSCRSCPSFPKTINRLKASKHVVRNLNPRRTM